MVRRPNLVLKPRFGGRPSIVSLKLFTRQKNGYVTMQPRIISRINGCVTITEPSVSMSTPPSTAERFRRVGGGDNTDGETGEHCNAGQATPALVVDTIQPESMPDQPRQAALDTKEMKILVLYAFHIYNERVEYFLRHALFKDPMFDFVVICNDLTIEIDVPDYVSVLKRNNTGYDFGAWSEGLLGNDRYSAYDHFVFVNSSVIGPYLPDGYTKPWPYRFIDGLRGNTKLFGSTINTIGDPANLSHVQSFAYAMDREALEFLISSDIFSVTKWAQTFNDAIWQHEVRMSRLIISRGWNIGSLMRHYADVDFTFTSRDPASYGVTWLHGDVMFPQYGLDRKEVMFLKGNRGFNIM